MNVGQKSIVHVKRFNISAQNNRATQYNYKLFMSNIAFNEKQLFTQSKHQLSPKHNLTS